MIRMCPFDAMSTTVIPATCTCGGLIPGLRQCPEHHRIFDGPKRLVSVSRIIKTFIPLPDIPADVMENARHRGDQCDKLFADYVRGTLRTIPAGTRLDVYDPVEKNGLLQKLIKWFDKQGFKKVEVQVLLGGEDHGGILDFRFDGMPTDLKATYDVSASHRLQVAGYHQIDPYATAKKGAAVLHVTERYTEARLIPLEFDDYDDWLRMLETYRMLSRRGIVKL